MMRWFAVPLFTGSVLGATALRAQDSCTACHGDRAMAASLASDSALAALLFVDPAAYRASVHGQLGFTCTLCHQGISDYPHGPVVPVDCAACHTQAGQELAQSVHGRPHPATGANPATCADCHTGHQIFRSSDPRSTVNRLTQFEGCARCHSDAERMRRFGQEDTATVQSYLTSVHGRGLLEKGLTIAPVCTDCHGERGTGAHEILPTSDSASPMSRARVVDTCARCHGGIKAAYDQSVHGAMFAGGNPDVPTCIECHTEHAVQPVASAASSVYPTHIAQTCTACHDREDLNDRYGLPTERRRTYLGSFHGIALEAGQLTVANCESCHGSHRILPSTDTASSVHPANLQTTCGSCHPGIGAGVAEGRVHIASVREDINLFAYGVQWLYYLLIAGIVLFAVSMISLDQYRHWVVDPRRRRPSHG
ncbi:MAG: cytochrome c3 family protein [Gemmatimonadetes bacterium]|nr:cytochrome c3 family protein [Gemmatimonadota bacterium]